MGDYIKLESGQEGYVVDIGWRTPRIRMLPNNMVIVPNAKLAESIVVNYHLSEKRMSVLILISVSYQSDPARIGAILAEEAISAIGHVPGLLAEPAPFVRFIPGFGESSLDFTLIVQYSGPRNLDSVISYTWDTKRGGPSGTHAQEVSAFI
jgi:small-conductance mechanosensitive channel